MSIRAAARGERKDDQGRGKTSRHRSLRAARRTCAAPAEGMQRACQTQLQTPKAWVGTLAARCAARGVAPPEAPQPRKPQRRGKDTGPRRAKRSCSVGSPRARVSSAALRQH
jgi:hypothetical protein